MCVNIFHIRDEGEPIKIGFNFYPYHSKNVGFVFRLRNITITIRRNFREYWRFTAQYG